MSNVPPEHQCWFCDRLALYHYAVPNMGWVRTCAQHRTHWIIDYAAVWRGMDTSE